MAVQFRNGIDLLRTALINAVLHPVSTDPSTVVDGQIWYRTDTDRFRLRANGITQDLAFLNDVTAGSITGALWDAQSVVTAVTDDNPTAQIIGEDQVLGRVTGGDITALTAAQLRTIVNVEDGATADQTPAEILADLLTVDGAGSGLDADTLDGVQGANYALVTYVDTEIANATAALIDSAPGTLDTLNELAAALGDDPNFSTTITNNLAGKTSKFAADIGDGALTDLPITHNLGTTDVQVTLWEIATNEQVFADLVRTSANVVTATFATAPATDSIRAVVVG